jgi:hypothetical protein
VVGDVVGDVVGAFVILHTAGRPVEPPNPSYPASHAQSQESLTPCVCPQVVWCAWRITGEQGSHVPELLNWQLKRKCPTLQF